MIKAGKIREKDVLTRVRYRIHTLIPNTILVTVTDIRTRLEVLCSTLILISLTIFNGDVSTA